MVALGRFWCCVLLVLPCRGASRLALGSSLSAVEASLRRSCGNPCRDFIGQAGSNAASTEAALQMASLRVRTRATSAQALAQASQTQLQGPCSTPAACKIRSLLVNKCNFQRDALFQAYQQTNIGVHTLGAMVSRLCGCATVGGRTHCALQTVPEVCIFPYDVYSSAFATSVQLWEAIKGATKTCSIHAGPNLSA